MHHHEQQDIILLQQHQPFSDSIDSINWINVAPWNNCNPSNWCSNLHQQQKTFSIYESIDCTICRCWVWKDKRMILISQDWHNLMIECLSATKTIELSFEFELFSSHNYHYIAKHQFESCQMHQSNNWANWFTPSRYKSYFRWRTISHHDQESLHS